MANFVYFLTLAVLGCANAMSLDSRSSRIANGAIAAENQFPYAISVQNNSPAAQGLVTRGHRCGGALVTLQHALTAASCLHDNVNGVAVLINPTLHRVFAGSSVLTNDTIADRIRNIANFTIHPNYSGEPAFLNDIAIITTRESPCLMDTSSVLEVTIVILNNAGLLVGVEKCEGLYSLLLTAFAPTTVTPLSLPAATFSPPDFTLCQVAGWGGENITNTASTQLRFANKYIYNQNLCTTLYNSQAYIPNVMPTMICAASFDIISSGCVNDYGNALVCEGTLTGILFMTDNCRASSFPELYTRVNNYTTWIRSVSASPTLFTPGVFVLTAILTLSHVFVRKY